MADCAITTLHLPRSIWYKDKNHHFSPTSLSLKISKRANFGAKNLNFKFKPPKVIPIAANWVASTDQVLLTISVIFAYMAGIIPRTGTGTSNFSGPNKKRNNENNFVKDFNSTRPAVNWQTEQKTQNYWDEIRTKLSEALEEKSNNSNMNIVGAKLEKSSKIRPLSLFALNVGPRVHLLAVTLQFLQNEVNNLSQSCESTDLFKNLMQPIFLKWIEEELSLQNGPPNLNLIDGINKKLKEDKRILKRLNSCGKIELYSEILFYLRFGSLRSDSCYDDNFLRENGIKILEDMIIFLADGIANLYLEIISLDGNLYSSERNNDLSLALCSLSTRALQRLRNEVALNWWINQYFESVVSMYEDRHELYIICQKSEKDQNANLNWWRFFLKTSTKSVEKYIQISPYSLSVKRTLELRALIGWRYYFSLFLELSDISTPFLSGGLKNVSNAISYFLTYIIGRSLGLIFSGIKQALGWR
ncbi:hypothetical protein LUZ60_004863 [Juncus effusus]|nr:hypothetical protein LUZ60_004863 [Juncus effusus]